VQKQILGQKKKKDVGGESGEGPLIEFFTAEGGLDQNDKEPGKSLKKNRKNEGGENSQGLGKKGTKKFSKLI